MTIEQFFKIFVIKGGRNLYILDADTNYSKHTRISTGLNKTSTNMESEKIEKKSATAD